MDFSDISPRLLSLVLPKRCICCDALIAPARLFCEQCASALSFIQPPLCKYCGQNKQTCGCQKHRFAFDKVAAPFYYETAIKGGVLRLKRYDDPDAIDYFAKQMQTVVRREYGDEQIDVLTYVPMTKKALRAREYNQSYLLAKALADLLCLPQKSLLIKLYETRPQKELKLSARSGNLLGVFDVTEMLNGKTVLLVDDVMTTGATLHECAKMLKLYGAKRVIAITVAVRKFQKKTE